MNASLGVLSVEKCNAQLLSCLFKATTALQHRMASLQALTSSLLALVVWLSSVVSFVDRVLLMTTDIRTSSSTDL